jgi:CO/xanthine dehydrogenase FAD-binding subunit
MYATLGTLRCHEPTTIQEAIARLAELGPKARILAGGCELLPAIRRRLAPVTDVVSLSHVPSLSAVRLDGTALHVGPMASLRMVAREPAVGRFFVALGEGVASVASVQVRATGTLVGNLCVATPASDLAPPLLVMDAELRVEGPRGGRVMPLADLFAGAKRNTLAADEIVTRVSVLRPAAGVGTAFAKLARTSGDCAKINAATYLELREGVCVGARIVLGAVAATPIRAPQAEAVLQGSRLDDETLRCASVTAVERILPISDVRSTAEYRRAAMSVLLRRVLTCAAQRARENLS